MRMLHILPSYLPAVRYGGPTFAVHGLCRALAARGHRVEVFTTNIDGPDNSSVPLGIPVLIDGVYVRYFPSNKLRRLFYSAPLAQALREEIAGFAVVHLHSVFLWPTWAAARLAKKVSVPYVISPRGMLVKELIKRRSRFAKEVWINLIERGNLQGASAIHVTSQVEAEELRRFGWRLPSIEVIPNGIDESASYSEDLVAADVADITAEKRFVLFLGRISWKKGVDRLISAFAKTKLPKLVIAGPDDENIVPQLTRLSQKLGIAKRVHFLPRVVLGADKEHLFACASLFVLPSHSENFGNTVLEAMQRALPVITTPEVGAAKIVSEASAGMVVSGDPEPLSAAISHLANTDLLARAMGEAGRRHVTERYGWQRIAAQMECLYGGLTPTGNIDSVT